MNPGSPAGAVSAEELRRRHRVTDAPSTVAQQIETLMRRNDVARTAAVSVLVAVTVRLPALSAPSDLIAAIRAFV